MSQNDTATVQELADRYGITKEALSQWLYRYPQVQPVSTTRPRRYHIATVDAARQAAGLRDDTDIPPGMGTVPTLARIVGRHPSTIGDALREHPEAPTPAGSVKRGGPVIHYYPIDAFRTWYAKQLNQSDEWALARRIGVDIESRVAPDKSPHGSEYRYKQLRCGCPVCQSARAAARARTRGAVDRVAGAIHDAARMFLDPGVDASVAANAALALAHPERIRILRVVAAAWPDAVPRAVITRVLGPVRAEHFRHLVDARLLSSEPVTSEGRRAECFRFVKRDGGAQQGQ